MKVSRSKWKLFLKKIVFLPWGIHVSLTESRLFLLLKAVLIPITMNAFFLTGPSWEETEEDSSVFSISLLLRLAANSIWSIEIDLSNVLKKNKTNLIMLTSKHSQINLLSHHILCKSKITLESRHLLNSFMGSENLLHYILIFLHRFLF